MILNDAIEEIMDNVMAVSAETNEENVKEMMEILTSSKMFSFLDRADQD